MKEYWEILRHLRTLCQFYHVSADYVLSLSAKDE